MTKGRTLLYFRVFKEALEMLGIGHQMSTTYHPESQLERFHQTLKNMLRRYCVETGVMQFK